MDNLNVKVKAAYDQLFPEESRLTEAEKQKIRKRVSSLKTKQPKRKLELFPRAVTIIVAACFLLFIGGVIGKEINLEVTQDKSDQHQTASVDEFYKGINVGDKVNGWELVSKQPDDAAKSDPSGLKKATFKGNAILKGGIVLTNEYDSAYPNKLGFLPDEQSIKMLPLDVDKGKVKEIILDFDDQASVEKILNIKPGDTFDHTTIEIDQYTANYKEGVEIPDTVHFTALLDMNGKNMTYDTSITLDANGQLILSAHLELVYSTFSKTYKDETLADLAPVDIFKLFYYAEERKDYKTQYALYMKDPEYEQTFKTVDEYAAAASQPEEQKASKSILEMVKASSIMEKIDSDSEAHIFISNKNGYGFGLTKNKKGIWKVNWMPLQ